jgi:hypothetical protein
MRFSVCIIKESRNCEGRKRLENIRTTQYSLKRMHNIDKPEVSLQLTSITVRIKQFAIMEAKFISRQS